ncbi:hypothetical protein DLAC_06324 [Tieghemostelium lacteum]|uniref:Uncharacterized protein n=1 Tax=Tieghemostelium lacteum TaxID=361077 RepID=A0A151ZEM1_TIELA|nr:hypothetical protein DLAC_06324 [Tieghemostelium lacteum]|eukprot:KYQ92360.1 hypothetical protein DLAC_06324 [Tieghemostelium lacteum]
MVCGFLIHTIDQQQQQQQQQQANSTNNIIYLSQFYTSEGNNQDFQKRQNAVISKVMKDYSFKLQCENFKPDEKLYPDWINIYSGKTQSIMVDNMNKSDQLQGISGTGTISSTQQQLIQQQQQLQQQQFPQHIGIGSKEGIFRILPKPKPSTLSQLTTNTDSETQILQDPSYYFQTSKYVIWKKLLGVCFTIICEEDENRLLVSNFLNMFSNIASDHFKNTLSKATPTQDIFPKTDELLVLLNSYLPNGQLLFISNQFSKHIKTTIPNILSS